MNDNVLALHERAMSTALVADFDQWLTPYAPWTFTTVSPGGFNPLMYRRCSIVFLAQMPSAADSRALYPTDYYSYQPPRLQPKWRFGLKRLVGLERTTYVPPFSPPGRMLNIGCGAGQYLLETRARGWEVYGSEINETAAPAGQAARIDVRGGELISATFDADFFDFVRLDHSFEHIPNPKEVLVEIGRVLRPSGFLFISVPNIADAWARLSGRCWWHVRARLHTFHNRPTNWSYLSNTCGLDVEQVRFNSDCGDLLGRPQIYLNRNRRPRSSDSPLMRSILAKSVATYLSRITDALQSGDCIEVIARGRAKA